MPSDEDILKQLKQDYRITFSSKEGERGGPVKTHAPRRHATAHYL